ncbi:MAG TPA: acyloxyacyl hydrolase [Acidobacteriaceae bacterium]
MLLSESIAPRYGKLPLHFLLGLFFLGAAALPAHGQGSDSNGYFARTNSFGIFGAWSNDSSHILLGFAERRKLAEIGFSYDRRLMIGRAVNWQFSLELLPVALESDPLGRSVVAQTAPTPQTVTYDDGAVVSCSSVKRTYAYTNNDTAYSGTTLSYCHGRQWTIGQAMSPVGFQWNFRPHRRLQPFAVAHGGYMYTTRPIPVALAGSFNFTFDIGAGVELFHTRSQSIRTGFRYHHISNHDTAYENPGIDSGLFQLTWVFGR